MPGGVTLSSHGDHRILMSLATAALGAQMPTVIDGVEHLTASYPDYFAAPDLQAQDLAALAEQIVS
jgi:3-phosphoshikimate 1-carboxyvinyltransferase